MATPKEVVEAWHDALNRGDVEGLARLVHPDVEIHGPRGSVSGVQMMREWALHANVRLLPQAYFANAQNILVPATGEWFDPANGQVTSSQPVVTLFSLDAGLITSITRYDPVV